MKSGTSKPLLTVFEEYQKNNELRVEFKHLHAKDTTDKEILIDNIFKEIQAGPIEELRDPELISAFEHAKGTNFEVCVLATMSAGKSTLINSMIGTKLMPSKQEACTAIITRIVDSKANGLLWKGEVYNKEGVLTETHDELNYATMSKLNGSSIVSEIVVTGNIPFLKSDDVSLVLIDTPGPNNSRDPQHRKTQIEFLSKSSKSLVLYIMTGEFGTDDDHNLLKRVADSMSIGGKQSKDRFIFVLNKLDDRKLEDGDTNQTLDKVRNYLKTHGIESPNLFPAAALPALNIRLIENNFTLDEYTIDETEVKVKKLNRNESLHFENYSSFPKSIQNEISLQVSKCKETNNKNLEALIHTGIPSVEAAIRQYVQKYAKTAKIKNIADTFIHKLESAGSFETVVKEILDNKDQVESIISRIALVQKKLDDAKLASKFTQSVEIIVNRVEENSIETVDKNVMKFQFEITKRIDDLRGKEIDEEDAKHDIDSLTDFSKNLESELELDLAEVITDNLLKASKNLLDEYRAKLSSLAEEIDLNNQSTISIDPLKLMGGLVTTDDFSIGTFVKSKEIADGTEWVPVPRKPILGLGLRDKWFGMKHEEKTKYKSVNYIDGSVLSQHFLAPLQEYVYENGDNAKEYTRRQSKSITESFKKEFFRLNELLKLKLNELNGYATDKEKAEQKLVEVEIKLEWLKNIKTKVEEILEI